MWIYILILGVVPVFLAILITINKQKITSESVLRYPRFFMMVGCRGNMTISLIAFFYLWTEKFEYKMLPVLLLIALLFCGGFYLILLFLNWKLEFLDEQFVYTNLFGKTTSFQYSEITKIIIYPEKWGGPEKYKIITSSKAITVECLVCNYSVFLKTLKKRMNKNKCRAIFEKKRKSRTIK